MRWVRTSVLLRLCSPFEGCWPQLSRPLRVAEVLTELESGRARLHAPFEFHLAQGADDERAWRRLHAQKVAWFALNGFQHPLEIDVGVPALGCHVGYPVIDGNHRYAAAIVRREVLGEDPWLPASVSGQVSYMKELGLA